MFNFLEVKPKTIEQKIMDLAVPSDCFFIATQFLSKINVHLYSKHRSLMNKFKIIDIVDYGNFVRFYHTKATKKVVEIIRELEISIVEMRENNKKVKY